MTKDIDIIKLFRDAQELEALIYKTKYAPNFNLNLYTIKQTITLPDEKSLQDKLSNLQKEYCAKLQEMLEDTKDPPEVTREVIDECNKESLDAIIRGTKLVLENLDLLWAYYVKCAGPKRGKKTIKKALEADHNYAQKRLAALAAEVS
jgi:hypothetical protein